MDYKFAELVNRLHPLYERLINCPPHTGKIRLPLDVPKCGVYLFSEADDHLYVGRTNRLRTRHREHWCGKHNDAPFAFKIARQNTGNPSSKGGLTRTQLSANTTFSTAFLEAKDRVASMDFRWVAEADPNRQCLLEIYATIVLEAKFNDFNNH